MVAKKKPKKYLSSEECERLVEELKERNRELKDRLDALGDEIERLKLLVCRPPVGC